ncbi:TlpA disulfide reductase family protein [Pseudomonas sp. RIT-PI-S]|uniref:TlpA disulfide reductase family protein n=1 Tax=Pseudomonas sp. RIT-PI-S TaxID=3035295 RepID=UPI0021DA0088|nr:TlpA disulfide reductase family protein [Pseudomonas sp. RIT-PI-S]
MVRCCKGYLLALLATLCLAGCGQDLGPDQHGQAVSGESLKGQWLVINYWAVWCGPCRREIPELNAFAAQAAAEGVQVLGVNFDPMRADELAQAAEQMGITYRVLVQNPAEALNLPAAEGLPVTFVLDPQRQVRATLLGEQTAAGLKQRLAQLRGG